ncbi:hypothetical protein WJ968_02185 [Achromobacter xylosoxidans]
MRKTDAVVAALLKQIAERRAQNPKENWLLVATSAYGLGGSGRRAPSTARRCRRTRPCRWR